MRRAQNLSKSVINGEGGMFYSVFTLMVNFNEVIKLSMVDAFKYYLAYRRPS